MPRPEEHLTLARECLSRGDFVTLLSALRDFDRDLRLLVNRTAVDPGSLRFYDSPETLPQTERSEASLRARVDVLRKEVDEILAACAMRREETRDELTTLRSQRQFQEPVAEDSGHWFRSKA